ncbi:MAG: methyltransferase, partial [Ruthenibacterium sp.]
ASHQGFTLLSTTGVGADIVYIIDSAPFKQGRYAPASHVKIVSPDYFFAHPADTVLIVAPGYTDEIAGIIRNKLENTVEIAVLKSRAIKLLE